MQKICIPRLESTGMTGVDDLQFECRPVLSSIHQEQYEAEKSAGWFIESLAWEITRKSLYPRIVGFTPQKWPREPALLQIVSSAEIEKNMYFSPGWAICRALRGWPPSLRSTRFSSSNKKTHKNCWFFDSKNGKTESRMSFPEFFLIEDSCCFSRNRKISGEQRNSTRALIL